ncbi:hypothetical protein KIPB_012983, partial [Kipferlia bialata]
VCLGDYARPTDVIEWNFQRSSGAWGQQGVGVTEEKSSMKEETPDNANDSEGKG